VSGDIIINQIWIILSFLLLRIIVSNKNNSQGLAFSGVLLYK
jgi:hypothetical protein